MARHKSPVHFEIPRDEDGHFLPKELWTKKEIREHDRLKNEGLLANPMKKTKVKGSKRAKELYIQPQGKSGKFVPKEKWTAAEKKLAKKAAEKGQTIAAQLPRDEKGRFLSPTGKKKKKKDIVPGQVEYPAMPMVRSGDGTGMHQGNVTVVYPPYPPPPAPPYPAPAQMTPLASPQPVIVQLPQTAEQSPLLHAKQYKQLSSATQGYAQGDIVKKLLEYHEKLQSRHESLLGKIEKLEESHALLAERDRLFSDEFDQLMAVQKEIAHRSKELNRLKHIQLEIEKVCRGESPVSPVDVLDEAETLIEGPFEEPQDYIESSFEEPTLLTPIEDLESISLKKNPRRSYPMYYVKRTFSERVGDTLSGLARNPLLAIVAIGAVVAIGYALYRAFKAFRFRTLNSVGVEIVGGTIYFPGEAPYTVTEDDKLWLARSIWGEVNRDPSAWARPDVQYGGAAVLWAFANHYITVGNKRNLYPTLGEFVQAYSQPINPRWDDASDSRCQSSPAMCTPDRLAFRQELRNTPWASFPPALQNLVLNFAAGQVQNPVGTRTDFRASGTGYVPPDPINVAGNVFGTSDSARRRPVEQVA